MLSQTYVPSTTPGPPQCWVVVLNFNGTADTMRCLESLAAVRHDATVLLVDNGSSDDVTAVARRAFPWVATLANGENLGYAGGNNRGIEVALREGAEYVILLNNDTVVAPRLVSALVGVASADSQVGVVGPIISYMEAPDTVRTDGCRFNLADNDGFFARQVVPVTTPPEPPRAVDVDIVNGCCLMISARCLRSIGLIEESFFLVHEESDLCLRALAAGYKAQVFSEVLVWHKGSESFARAGNGLQRYFDVRNLSLLLRRHPPSRARQRSRAASWMEYLKYAYFVYCLERERGTVASATAVVEGLHDALTSTFGPRVSRTRPLAGLLRLVLESKRRLPFARA